jgi:multiple sugar transport system substrate-binding protein
MKVEIEFSRIDEPSEALLLLLETFQKRTQVRVHMKVMDWDTAWPELVSYALYGKGPDVSHIGSTWTSSLVMMNALRPFTRGEVAALGTEAAFAAPCWRSVTLPNDPTAWAIPWTAFTYIIAYRRDLLAQAGIDESTAFTTPAAMVATLQRLHEAGMSSPWIIPSGPGYVDLVHICASWVWGSQGDFISADGKQILFDHPEARTSLHDFFRLYRFLAQDDHPLSEEECFARFAGGNAAIFITGAEVAAEIALGSGTPIVRENLGTAPLPGRPWVGGDNLVIWRHAQAYPERERAAVQLANFLASHPAQMELCRQGEYFPVRLETLHALTLKPDSLAQTIAQIYDNGWSHKTVPLWGRVEKQLGQELNNIAEAVLAQPDTDPEALIQAHLNPLARRLRLMLG